MGITTLIFTHRKAREKRWEENIIIHITTEELVKIILGQQQSTEPLFDIKGIFGGGGMQAGIKTMYT